MRRILSLSSVIALTVMMSSFSYGQIIEFRFEDAGLSSINTSTFGDQIEDAVLFDLPLNPVTVALNPDTGVNSSLATTGRTGDARAVPLEITAIAGTGTGAGAHINASSSEFGIDSTGANPIGGSQSDDSTAFDSEFNESVTLSFSEDLFFRQIDFNSLFSDDQFSIQVDGSSALLIGINDTTGGTTGIFNAFTGDTTPSGESGLFVAAGTGVEFRATNGSVGLESLVVEIAETTAAVPEPSSMLGLMGLAGLLAVKRRR